MEHESITGETTRWQRTDPGVLFTDTISDIVDVLERLSIAIEHHDPDSVEGAVRLSVCMWLTAHTAHRQLIERSEGDMADRSGSLLEARGSLLELSVRATTAIADWRQLLLPANDNCSCRSATGWSCGVGFGWVDVVGGRG